MIKAKFGKTVLTKHQHCHYYHYYHQHPGAPNCLA